MAWGKIDDKLYSSPKWLAAKKGSRALWTSGLSWSMAQLTDGAIPVHVLGTLDGTRGEAANLVSVGLWERTEDGWQFHDWADYQPSREQVLAERDAAKERQRRARDRARESRAPRESHRDEDVTHGEVTPVVTVPPTRPDPTPIPEPKGSGSARPTAVAAGDALSAQTLVAEWIDHCGDRPPSRVVGQVSKELGLMLGEGIGYDDVRRGFAAWHTKGLHPSALASVVHETRMGPRSSKQSPTEATLDVLRMGAEMQADLDRLQVGA